ncbi:DNA ligase 1-like isoform X1 [Quillaja saponaria]|uniref:DNA ligase 1-like isoform X1 n=1 Tax=Quillaja saponaria TaxID=32244 RepID=A0AAD7LWX0_QUISA|nr:DNA ligase 1-like isoform X1 [Quillaja saponaria]
MAEETVQKVVKVEEAPDIESQIQETMRTRVSHFKEQSDSLTFEGVRRLLEKDLGLETYALDVHKRFIKQCLLKCLDEVNDDDASKNSEDTGQKSASREEAAGLQEDAKEPCIQDEDKMEDSPVLGQLNGTKLVKLETEEAEGNGNKVPSESTIKKAISKRASYIKANSEKVTMAGVRRLLEEDLKLDKYTLDPVKKLISQQLEEVLKSSTNDQKIVKKISDSKAAKKPISEEGSDSSDQGTDEEDEDKVKPRKSSIAKGKVKDFDEPKKRKQPAEDTSLSSKKRSKPAESTSEDNSDGEDKNKSEDDQSQSSAEKPAKKKEVLAPAYGKRVEHLKSVVKACGMSVPPSIYKKVKQVPENKREAHLIKELEEILSKEGLSSNPSEKEIKEVRRKKERAKELEGIDMSNIVASSRRRSTASFVAPPPKAKSPVQTDADDAEDTDNENNEGEDDDEEDEEEEEKRKKRKKRRKARVRRSLMRTRTVIESCIRRLVRLQKAVPWRLKGNGV